MSEIPEFILLGSSVLNYLVQKIQTELEFDDEFDIDLNPEVLRRIKLNECDDSDLFLVKSIATACLKLETGVSLSLEQCCVEDMVYIISAHIIKHHVWNEHIMKTSLRALQESCPHLLANHITISTDLSIAPPFSLNCDINELEVLNHRYSTILQKLKLLKQLEKTHVQLETVVVELLEKLPKTFDIQRVVANLSDGVQLVGTNVPDKEHLNSCMGGYDQLTHEVGLFRQLEKSIEEHRRQEELFWRWLLPTAVATSSPEIKLKGSKLPISLKLTSIVDNLTSGSNLGNSEEIVLAKHKLQAFLDYIEPTVTEGVFNYKVSVESIEGIVAQRNTELLSVQAENLLAAADSNGNHSLVKVDQLVSETNQIAARLSYLPLGMTVLQCEVGNDIAVKDISEKVKTGNLELMKGIQDTANDFSPFYCVTR